MQGQLAEAQAARESAEGHAAALQQKADLSEDLQVQLQQQADLVKDLQVQLHNREVAIQGLSEQLSADGDQLQAVMVRVVTAGIVGPDKLDLKKIGISGCFLGMTCVRSATQHSCPPSCKQRKRHNPNRNRMPLSPSTQTSLDFQSNK